MKQKLDVTHPHLLDEWDYDKNQVLPSEVTFGSHTKVWWKCSKGHSWYLTVNSRTNNKNGCPVCAGKFVSDENRLTIKYPDVVKYWDYQNNTVKPEDCSFGSHKKVHMICESCNRSHLIQINHIRGIWDCIICREDKADNKPNEELLKLCDDKIEYVKDGKTSTRYWISLYVRGERYRAIRRGKEWKLTDLQTAKLAFTSCHYCKSYYHKSMGIDRKDNNIGYLPENAVSCCWACNSAKSNKTMSQFKSWIIRVATKSGKSNCNKNFKYNKLLYSYKRGAETRELKFNLTDEEFKALIGKPCHYCNETAYGVDRLDSSIGYEKLNCVSCCGECNKAKLTLSVEQFQELITKLYNNIDNF